MESVSTNEIRVLKKGKFWKETVAQISSTLSPEKVSKRLNSVFSTPIDLSENYYFSSLVDCRGKIAGNFITIEFVKYGRGSLRYDLTGEILDNPDGGSDIKLKICDKYLLWGYIKTALIGFFLPVLIGSMRDVSWFIILLIGIGLAAVLSLIYLVVDFQKRHSILRNICEVLEKKLRETR